MTTNYVIDDVVMKKDGHHEVALVNFVNIAKIANH